MERAKSVAEMIELLATNGYTMQDLANLVRSLEVVATSVQKQQITNADAKLKNHVSDILKELGIYPSQPGFTYLRTAIIMKYLNPKEIKQMELYEKVADFHGITGDWAKRRVERAIKLAIDIGFSNGDYNAWKKYFEEETLTYETRPKNYQFIATIVEFLSQESNQ